MRIAVEALGIHYFGGGRSATLNLLEALFALDTQNEYLVILSEPESSLATPAGNVRQWVAPLRDRFALRIWAQLFLPVGLRGYDLVHFAKNLGVFGVPARTVITVYDLTTLIYPDLFPYFDVWYWQHIERRTLQAADRIVAISHSTAGDIMRFYDIPSECIQVIYPACAPHFLPASEDEIIRVRQRYGLPEQFILHVGRIDRKKNLPLLVEAFAQFQEQTRFEGKLVLVGEEYRKSRDLFLDPTIEHLGLRQHVIFTGCVPDADMPALYSGALVAVLPSLHEGFGLVALEAMACGTPLIVNRAGAVAEVVDDAAVILESVEVDCVAEALVHMMQDPELHQAMRRKGLSRAQRFRWEDTARQTLQLYEEVVAQRKCVET